MNTPSGDETQLYLRELSAEAAPRCFGSTRSIALVEAYQTSSRILARMELVAQQARDLFNLRN